jgi:integrase
MQKEKNKRILQSHPYKIYESNGTWYTHLPDSGKTEKRRKIKRKSKQALEKAIVDYYTSHENQMTVEDIFNAWNDDRLKYGYIAGSTHLRDKKFFKQYLMPTPMASRQIDSVSREEWTAWTQAQLDNGITAKQWSGLRGIIKGILHYAEDHHYIPYSAEDMLQRVRIHKNAFKKRKKSDSEEIYYSEDLQKLRDYCLKNWDAYTSCIWLISISGLRVGEATSLTPDDIDLTAMTINVHRTKTRGDETGQTLATVRDVPKQMPERGKCRFRLLRENVLLKSCGIAKTTIGKSRKIPMRNR